MGRIPVAGLVPRNVLSMLLNALLFHHSQLNADSFLVPGRSGFGRSAAGKQGWGVNSGVGLL